MERPVISVIVPIYQAERYLPRCLDSILGQTYSELQVILVDDGSPDSSGRICDAYEKKDSRIVVIHQDNRGVAEARNRGLEAATGEYIGFVDADDWIEPQMYKILYEQICKENTQLAVCNYYICKDGQTQKNMLPESLSESGVLTVDKVYPLMLLQNTFECYVWNKLYHRSLFEGPQGLRFHPEVFVCEDRLLCAELLRKIDYVAYSTVPCYHYLIWDHVAKTNKEKTKNGLFVRKQILERIPPKYASYDKASYLRFLVMHACDVLDEGDLEQFWELYGEFLSIREEYGKCYHQCKRIYNMNGRVLMSLVLVNFSWGCRLWCALRRFRG